MIVRDEMQHVMRVIHHIHHNIRHSHVVVSEHVVMMVPTPIQVMMVIVGIGNVVL